MSRVDFYILQNSVADGRYLFACKLAEKVHSLGNRIYIHTSSAADSAALDELLWTFRAGSFLPHAISQDESMPVLIGHDSEPTDQRQVLINLAGSVPSFFSRFERVVEIIENGDAERQDGRVRFKSYREHGIEPTPHNLTL